MMDIIKSKQFKMYLLISIIVMYCVSLFLGTGLRGEFTGEERVHARFIAETILCSLAIIYVFVFNKIDKREYKLIAILLLVTISTGFHILFIWSLLYFVLKGEDENIPVLTVIATQTFLLVANTMYLGGYNEVFVGSGRLHIGFTNPNRASMHCMTIVLFSIYYFRKTKFNIIVYTIGLLVVLELKTFTGTKSMLPVYLSLFPIVIDEKFYKKIFKRIINSKKHISKLKYVVFATPVYIMALPFLVSTVMYSEGINDFLTSRPTHWGNALKAQTNYLFGELNIFTFMDGTNRTLDNDYIHMFYIGGFVFILFAALILVGFVRNLILKEKYQECIFVLGILTYGLAERNMALSPSLILVLIPIFWFYEKEVN